jgi:ferric-chelate reductase
MLAPTWLDISVRIFVTGRDSSIVDFMDNLRKNNGSMESIGGADTRSITDESFGSSGEDMKKTGVISSLTSLPSVSVIQGRPDFTTELRNEVDIAPGRMSVSGECLHNITKEEEKETIADISSLLPLYLLIVCGSQAVAKSIRQALRFPVGSPSRILRGGASVTLFIEAFGFA